MSSNSTLPWLLCLTIVTLFVLSGCDSQSSNEDTIADKQVRFDFDLGFLGGGSTGEITIDEITRFNISNHVGVDSAVFVARNFATDDSAVPAVVELRNATDGEVITSVQTASTSFTDVETTGFLENLPDKNITLTAVLYPETDTVTANIEQPGGASLLLYRDF